MNLTPESRLKRTVRVLLFSLVCFVTLVALFYAEENWRGKRGWEKFRKEEPAFSSLVAGEGLTSRQVPDEQNFVKAQIFEALSQKGLAPTNPWSQVRGWLPPGPHSGDFLNAKMTDLAGYQGELRTRKVSLPPLPQEPASDIMAVLSRIEPELKELRRASRLSYAQFSDDDPDQLIGRFIAARTIAQTVSLAACAELASGQSSDAFADTYVVYRVAEATGAPTRLISAMMRVAITGASLQPVWEGIVTHRWSDEQLRDLGKLFCRMNLLADLDRARSAESQRLLSASFEVYLLRYHRILFGQQRRNYTWAEKSRYWFQWLAPHGWFYQNKLCYAQAFQKLRLTAYDVHEQRVFPKKFEIVADELGRETAYNRLAHASINNFIKAFRTTAAVQTAVDEAVVACALERYRLAKGQYPETLNRLVPAFLDKLPHDVITGQLLKYHPTEPGRFVLYSVGWNETDEGGTTDPNRRSDMRSSERGDWVWQYPDLSSK